MAVPITCLSKKTLIKMADGSEKFISELKVGDVILSHNFETVMDEPSTIKIINPPVHENMVRLVLQDKIVECTPSHPFYSNQHGWVSVNPYRTEMYYRFIDSCKEIKPNMKLKFGKDEIEVLFAVRYTKRQTTYCINQLSKNHTYYANGLLTAVE